MSTINVQCTDQVLAITNSPVIASGGANENDIQFSFCSKWDGYAKICVFYRQGESYYYSLIDANDKCKIPDECLVSSGKIHFGVVGVGATDNSLRRTSEILTYRIVAGVMTEIADPTPEIYQQILNELQQVREALEKGQIDINGLTAETDVVNSDYFLFYDVSASANRKTLWSNIIDKIRAAFKTTSLPVDSGGTGATDAKTARTNLGITPANIGALPTTAGAVNTSNLANTSVTADKLANDIPYTKFGISENQVRTIYIGTAEPTADIGNDGDIYIQYS